MLGDLTSAVSSALYTPWYCTLVQHRPPRAQAAIPHTPTSTHTKWGINPPFKGHSSSYPTAKCRTNGLPAGAKGRGRKALCGFYGATGDSPETSCAPAAGFPQEVSHQACSWDQIPSLVNRRVRLQSGRKNNLSFVS